jgi:hypothetical protein
MIHIKGINAITFVGDDHDIVDTCSPHVQIGDKQRLSNNQTIGNKGAQLTESRRVYIRGSERCLLIEKTFTGKISLPL